MKELFITKWFVTILLFISCGLIAFRSIRPVLSDDIAVEQQDDYAQFLRSGNGSGMNLSHLDLRYAIQSLRDKKGIDFRISFVDADVSRSNMSKTCLDRVNFLRVNAVGAYFAQANLSRANLREANLSKAVFTNANLSGARLTKANVTGANFSGANLTGTDFSGAIVDGALFENAILYGVIGLHVR